MFEPVCRLGLSPQVALRRAAERDERAVAGACPATGTSRLCELSAVDGESAAEGDVEGDVEGVEYGLPAHGPVFAALRGGVQAHDGRVDARQHCGLVREVTARMTQIGQSRLARPPAA